MNFYKTLCATVFLRPWSPETRRAQRLETGTTRGVRALLSLGSCLTLSSARWIPLWSSSLFALFFHLHSCLILIYFPSSFFPYYFLFFILVYFKCHILFLLSLTPFCLLPSSFYVVLNFIFFLAMTCFYSTLWLFLPYSSLSKPFCS